MRKISARIGVAALAAVLLAGFAFAISPAIAAPPLSNEGFGRLLEPNGPASWLVDHYDNRGADVTGGPDFDDSANVKFKGTIAGIGKVTVEQSAAWTFTTFDAPGGGSAPDAGPCAVVYDTSRTLVRIHKHQGVSTELVTAGPTLTRIPGSAVNNPGGTTEFPFSATGTGANGLFVDTETFTATFTVTKKGSGETITGIVEGGTNCEVEVFFTAGGHTPGIFDVPAAGHNDTNNTVQTALEITGGTVDFAGVTGIGTLSFTYDTFEPHGLIEAHIVLTFD